MKITGQKRVIVMDAKKRIGKKYGIQFHRPHTEVILLAKRECCNNLRNGCLLIQRNCRLEFGERCKYFEEVVLPLKEELIYAYRKEFGKGKGK